MYVTYVRRATMTRLTRLDWLGARIHVRMYRYVLILRVRSTIRMYVMSRPYVHVQCTHKTHKNHVPAGTYGKNGCWGFQNTKKNVSTRRQHDLARRHMFPHVSTRFHMFPHVSTCFHMFPHVSTRFHMFPHVSARFRTYHVHRVSVLSLRGVNIIN